MAEIVQNAPPTQNVGSAWDSFVALIVNYWWVLLLFCIIIALIVICFYIWKKKEENDRRRDSSVYATAMNIQEATELNARKQWIRNRYSLLNILWLGIPFKWVEHSVKIVDVDRNFLGYYRGQTRTQDGDLVFLLYKNRTWLGLFEDKFMLYCPTKLRKPKSNEIKSKDGKTKIEVEKDQKGNIIYEYISLPENFFIYDVEKGNEIKINCNTITRQGNYYFFPNYVFSTEHGQKHIDLTDHISSSIAKVNYLVQLEVAYSDMSRMAGRAVEFNPHLTYDQKSPQKEKKIEEDNPSGENG